jgi:predicted 2-oxoglutarate/Fe(II)-dependent dioxygenase YbiX/peroxiredoxin
MIRQTVSRSMKSYASLSPGDPAPWFRQRATGNPNYAFDTVAGRTVVMCFLGSAADPGARAALAAVRANRALFDDYTVCFFGISIDPADEAEGRLQQSLPGIRFFWDADQTVSRKYGVLPVEPGAVAPDDLRRSWIVLDRALRVLSVVPFAPDGSDCVAVLDYLHRLHAPARAPGSPLPIPVLWLPNVFEPELCRALIDSYEQEGGKESGFMRDVDGRTALLHDAAHKRRKDATVSNPRLIQWIQDRVRRRIAPEIAKVHYFKATRMERYIVACYAAEDGGHFRPHRDNVSKGTAHRRYAVSINLNENFDGGTLSFPEYGTEQFHLPSGTAVVFSCSLMHAVAPVTRGRRYAFLPFLYDDAAAKIREENHRFLADGFGDYKA